MAITFKIFVGGLAALYRNQANNAWNVTFLTESVVQPDMHKLNFSWKKDGEFSEPVSLAGKTSINLEYSDPNIPTSFKGRRYKKIFNFCAIYAHRDGVYINNSPSGDWRQTHMVIPYSILHHEIPTNKEYGIRKATDPVEKVYPIGTVANVVGLELTLRTGDLVMKVPDMEDLLFNEDGASYTLVFNNDCERCVTDDGDDFTVYYELVLDKLIPTLKFIAGRIEEDKLGIFAVIPDGNCDPVVIDPPPEPEP